MVSPTRSGREQPRRRARIGRRLRIVAARWAQFVARRPGRVFAAGLALAVLSALYAALSLEISTSNRDLISGDVPYRQNQAAFVQSFPQFDDVILMVVDGQTPEAADVSAARLRAALQVRQHAFASIYAPSSEPFFQRNGLLYLSLDDLEALADRIARIQPLLVRLAQDPSLPTLFNLLADATAAIGQGTLTPGDFAPVMAELADAVDAALTGDGVGLSWRSLLSGGEADPLETRQFVLVQPLPVVPTDLSDVRSPRRLALDAVDQAVAEALAPSTAGQVTVRLTGAPVLAQAELTTVREGALLAGTLSFVAVALILIRGLGSLRSVLAVLLTLVIGLVWTVGYATLVLGRLNLISVTFIVLFVGLAVDFGIHFVLRWREVRMRLRSPVRVLGTTSHAVAWALTLSACGAALGFFSFVPTDYTGLAELGIIAGGSMFIALAAFLTVLPALLRLLPARYGLSRATMRKRRREPTLLIWLARQPRWSVVAAVAGLGLVAVVLASRVEFDANPLNLQDPETEAAMTLADLRMDVRTSPDTVNAVADSLDAADALAERLDGLAPVGQTLTLSDFVPRHQEDKYFLIDTLALSLWPAFADPEPRRPVDDASRAESLVRLVGALTAVSAGAAAIDDEAYRTAAADLAEALGRLQQAAQDDGAVWIMTEEHLLGTLPGLLDRLERVLSPDLEPITLDDLPADLRDRWLTGGGRARVEIRPAAPLDNAQALQRFSDAIRTVVPEATGGPVAIAGGAEVVTRAFVTATALTSVLVIALLVLVRLSWRCVGLILVPLMLAASLTLASAVILDQPLNFANIIALPLVFGLGVSSSIHLVMRWDQGGRDLAVLNTSTPQAVLLSALTTAASFGTLALSPHPGTASMGLLLSVALLQVLFCTLVVLPALLSLASRQRSPVAILA